MMAAPSRSSVKVTITAGARTHANWILVSADSSTVLTPSSNRRDSFPDNEPARIYRVGEGFYENPGSHHRVSENASDREAASLLAVFIVDVGDASLTTPSRN
jgi:hypothetical protein